MTDRRGSRRFLRGLLTYVLIFILIAAIVLGVFYFYLKAYEESRPVSAVRQYMSDCARGRLSYEWGACLAGLDRRVQSEADTKEWLVETLRGAAFRELGSANAGERLYGIYDEAGNRLVRLTLRQTGREHWGFTDWNVEEEACDLSAVTQTVSVTVPANYRVTVGGKELDPAYLAQTGIPYETLESFAGQLSPLPTLVRYEIGPCLTLGEVRVYDPAGHEVPEEERTERRFLDNCGREDREQLAELAESFLEPYLRYAAELEWEYNYRQRLYPLIVHGGELEKRLVAARSAFGYSNTRSIDVLRFTPTLCTDLGSGQYLIEFEYTIHTVGLHEAADEDYEMRLLVEEQDGSLYVGSMWNRQLLEEETR